MASVDYYKVYQMKYFCFLQKKIENYLSATGILL